MCHWVEEPRRRKVREEEYGHVLPFPKARPKRAAPAIATAFRRLLDRIRRPGTETPRKKLAGV